MRFLKYQMGVFDSPIWDCCAEGEREQGGGHCQRESQPAWGSRGCARLRKYNGQHLTIDWVGRDGREEESGPTARFLRGKRQVPVSFAKRTA